MNTQALSPIPLALEQRLRSMGRKRWLVTGAAGFIGSNIVENLLFCGQEVVGLDNFSTGFQRNLDEIKARVPQSCWANWRFFEADINDAQGVRKAVDGCDYVLHQAALGSVPRSIKDPIATFEANVRGFTNVLNLARLASVQSFVYASSSSVYGDHPDLPKVESKVGNVLSPYAASKASNELFAAVFSRSYAFNCVGLRYFNVFGPRQDPDGAYAAVIPKWIQSLLLNESPVINGDGETSRDFCFVANAVQANILSAINQPEAPEHRVFNVAFQQQTSLNQLFQMLQSRVGHLRPKALQVSASTRGFREGDVRHSLADITSAKNLIGYAPEFDLSQGLELAMPWYLAHAEDSLKSD
jgi:UDP-N-acetylglucosamine/UDP-N-acetylgalactosamine 4-epimerase